MIANERPDWWDDAACRFHPVDLFFPQQGGAWQAAKDICNACPVRQDCLDWALAEGIRHGIWGGKSERERRTMRRTLGLADPAPHGKRRYVVSAERTTPKPRPRKADVVHGTLTAVNAGCHCRACEARRNRGGYLRVVGE